MHVGVKNTCRLTGVESVFNCAWLSLRETRLLRPRHADGLKQRRQLVAERRAVIPDALARGGGDDDGRHAIHAVLSGFLLVEHEVQHVERDIAIVCDDLLQHAPGRRARLAPNRLLEEDETYHLPPI